MTDKICHVCDTPTHHYADEGDGTITCLACVLDERDEATKEANTYRKELEDLRIGYERFKEVTEDMATEIAIKVRGHAWCVGKHVVREIVAEYVAACDPVENDDSDVYVYWSVNGNLVCCACHMSAPVRGRAAMGGSLIEYHEDWETQSIDEMVKHLGKHQAIGHKVPARAFENLETARGDYDWLPRRVFRALKLLVTGVSE